MFDGVDAQEIVGQGPVPLGVEVGDGDGVEVGVEVAVAVGVAATLIYGKATVCSTPRKLATE